MGAVLGIKKKKPIKFLSNCKKYIKDHGLLFRLKGYLEILLILIFSNIYVGSRKLSCKLR